MLLKSRVPQQWKNIQVQNNRIARLLSSHQSITLSHNIRILRCFTNGDLETARNLFDEMPRRTIASWNTMISGHTKHGSPNLALHFIPRMHSSGAIPNDATFTSALAACARTGSLALGKQLHSLALQSGSSERSRLVGSALLNLYTACLDIDDARRIFNPENPLMWSPMLVGFVRCNMMGHAHDLFEQIPVRDVFSWTSMISGYARSAVPQECGMALELFVRMRRSGETAPNEFTYDSVLRACAALQDVGYGKTIHGCLLKCGSELDRSVRGALVNFYCQFEALDDAMRVFDQLDDACLNTCNAMIWSLVSVGRIGDAEMIFSQMTERNPLSYHLMMKGYEQGGRLGDAKHLFHKMPCKNIISMNTMMSLYHRNGEFNKALELFDQIKGERNTVTWNSMISGYVQNDQPVEALRLYVEMHRLSIECSRSTFSALFRACASIGTLHQGRMFHARLSRTPFESNVYVGTSLVDMYSKCGSIADARRSFLFINSPNVASWTAIINGLAHHGLGVEAVLEFERMIKYGIEPNAVTFTGLLLACGRAGMVDEGRRFFHAMEKDYGLVPTLEHYACMVGLLGRSGCTREAEKFIHEMPIEADVVVWGTLLTSCWLSMELDVGERVAERLLCLDSKLMSIYVIMSNIYAKLEKWEEVLKVRKRLRDLNVKKDPGCSWIEVKDTVHVFCVDDRDHPERDDIYAALEDLVANVCFYHEAVHNSYIYIMDDVLVPSFCFYN